MKYQNTQKEYFAKAISEVQLAWPKDQWPKRNILPNMWKALRALKEEGVLVDGWNDKARVDLVFCDEPTDKFSSISHAYAERIRGKSVAI